MDKLFIFGFTVVVFVLSVPLHELFHVLGVKCLGGEGKLKITWLDLNWSKIGGSVTGEISFPRLAKWDKHYKLVGFIVGLSGGLGAAIVLAGIGILFFLNPPEYIFDLIWKPFFVIAGFHLIEGVFEAIKTSKQIEPDE